MRYRGRNQRGRDLSATRAVLKDQLARARERGATEQQIIEICTTWAQTPGDTDYDRDRRTVGQGMLEQLRGAYLDKPTSAGQRRFRIIGEDFEVEGLAVDGRAVELPAEPVEISRMRGWTGRRVRTYCQQRGWLFEAA